MSKFYITTPIYYVNDQPHLGHAYTTILADVMARYHRAAGDDVHFLTGTDEHGLKVQQAAQARDTSPQSHTDEYVQRFQDLWQRLHISNDDFIRTTEERHKIVVQGVLQTLYDKGEIYQSEYDGLYSVAEERFLTSREAESGDFKQIEKIKETNWFFRMSSYQNRLIAHIEAHPKFIRPESRRNEVLGFLRQPLKDLCISRPKSRLAWGIELPFDRDYVTYVWFDALLNYVSAVGYDADEKRFNQWWPADIQLIGKDILTAHAVYWPTMLMAAGIDLPKTIFAHGWWLMGTDKMSKSAGNAVQPLDLIALVGVDPVRYFLMREMVLGQDASFTTEQFMRRYNSDLANDLGNLTSRVSKFIRRHYDARVPPPVTPAEPKWEDELKAVAAQVVAAVPALIEDMRLHDAIAASMDLIRRVNVYLEQTQPWKQIKEDHATAGNTLYVAAEALRIGAQLLHPVMPNRMDTIRRLIGAGGVGLLDLEWGGIVPGTQIAEPQAPFPRLDSLPTTEPEEPQAATGKNLATFDDFAAVDLRIAEILAAEPVEGTDKLLKLRVGLDGEERQIVAGIAKHYSAENLIGKRVVLVANLQPATIRGTQSEGMLLAAAGQDTLVLATVDQPDMAPGAKVG